VLGVSAIPEHWIAALAEKGRIQKGRLAVMFY
jgi:hypothetical protein